MATDSIDELRESILDLSAEDRDRLFRRLARDVVSDQYRSLAALPDGSPLAAYCREYPDDPICAGLVPPWMGSMPSTGTSGSEIRPDRSHLQGFPSGGGCTEAWEFLSAMRGGN